MTKIDDDKDIQPDTNLSGYQDDLATGDKEDVVQEQYGESPSEYMQMPESELKEELDGLDFRGQEGSGESLEVDDDTQQAQDDKREFVEDMDENDKDAFETKGQ